MNKQRIFILAFLMCMLSVLAVSATDNLTNENANINGFASVNIDLIPTNSLIHITIHGDNPVGNMQITILPYGYQIANTNCEDNNISENDIANLNLILI